jgi:hypothetical protein
MREAQQISLSLAHEVRSPMSLPVQAPAALLSVVTGVG